MNWLQRLVRSDRMDKDLDKELSFHFETQVADKVRAGMTEAEARRATRLEFGGLTQVKEECRKSRGTLWLATIAQDLRFGCRILLRSPGFSLTAILVLALGIGVCTLAFSLYNLLVMQSIPVRDAATLVHIERRSPENITPGVPYNSIAYYRDHTQSLSAVMAAMSGSPMVFEQDEKRISESFVTANYFNELGGTAVVGRLIDAAREDSTSSAPVVLLSYRFWQRRFQGDASVIGKTIHLNGKPATVIGVTSEHFASLGTNNPDVWLPFLQHSYFVDGSKAVTDPRFDGNIIMWGRLAPGGGASTAAQELLSLTNQLRKLYPTVIWDNERILVTPGAHFISLEDGAPVLVFVALLVLLIMAIACANLGGLLTARGASRQREIELRFHLGAQKWRLFRQLVTENLLLGVLGSIAALPVSYVALRATLTYANAPSWMSALPDWRVLLFTACLGFVAALFFGMLPTIRMVRRNTKKGLWNQIVVCAQVGGSCVLLILAGLLVRATLHTLYTNPGFGYQQVVSINPGLSDHGFTSVAAKTYLDQMQSRLKTLPGITSIATVLSPPLVNDMVMITSIDVNGRRIMIYPNWVSPRFFETMAIPMIRGRDFAPGESHVIIISQSLAARRWPNEDPIGKPWNDKNDIVIGVVGNTRAMELNNTDATEIYYPPSAEQFPQMSILIRTAGTPIGLLPSVKTITASIDQRLLPTITPLEAGYRKSLAQVEQIAAIVSLLGGIAVLLAVVGLLGLVSFAVTQRTKEIAIRLALGASHAEIFSAITRRFAWPVVIGLVVGIGATGSLSQILRRALYGVSGLDPLAYAGAALLLVLILAAAATFPIRRSFRLQIARILHAE